MADEKDKPQADDQSLENPTPIDPENLPEALQEAQVKTIREMRAETVAPQEMPDGAREVREAETAGETAARREIEDTLDKPIEAIEDTVNIFDALDTPKHPAQALAHDPGDVTNVFGRFTINMPIYDVVFISLVIFTALEVFASEIFDISPVLILFLMAVAFVKAFHVVWYYMHLGSDSKVFWITLLLPFLIAIVSLIFLMVVPQHSYYY